MKYSEKDMAALISEVETQFAEHLAKAEEEQKPNLQKSEEANEVAEAAATTSDTETSTEEFTYDEDDIAEMDKLYGSMSKAEAEAHYKSLKKNLFADEASEEVETQKTETEANAEVKKSEKSDNNLKKFESENEELKKSNEELKKNYEDLQKNFEKLVSTLTESVKKGSAPKQKAITKIQYIAKSEEENKKEDKKEEDVAKLNKSEIAKRLTNKIREGSLKKSDKEAINEYYLEKGKNIESIRHLL